MSGICGALRRDGPDPAGDVDSMLRALEPWGTVSGRWESGDGAVRAALGCRLRVLAPEDEGDRQPRISRDRALVLVADARLDNREELQRGLGIPAADMRDTPDSALIMAAWQSWGESCVRRLLGDFAFILWDLREQTLFAARDPAGQRVLFWHEGPAGTTVASTAAALLSLKQVPARLNEQKVADFLGLLQDAESTYYEGIHRLAPGHMLKAAGSTVGTRRFSSIEPGRIRFRSDDEYIEAFHEVFGRAVEARLRSTSPIGISLSGGLDSSAVAAVAAVRLRARNQKLYAFHAAPREGFSGEVRPGWVADESADVRDIAAMHDHMDLRILRSCARTPLDSLEPLFRFTGGPVRNPGNLSWGEAIYEMAGREGVRVLLNGQKGNWTISFTGLRSLLDAARGGRIPRLVREARAVARVRGSTTAEVLKDVVIRPLAPEFLLRLYARVHGRELERGPVVSDSLIRDDFARAMHLEERTIERREDEAVQRRIGSFEYRVLGLTTTGDAPDVTHGMRSWFGVETRDPTSDMRVIEFCLSIPGDQYLRGGQERWLVRRAMRGILPSSVLDRTTRGAQAADWAEWFPALREPIRAEIERLEASATAQRCLDLARMRRMVEEWPDRFGIEHLADYPLMLLRGVVMGRFIRWFEETYA